jgi:oligopeptide/dipeptide ABC transporter ATP-binding protein
VLGDPQHPYTRELLAAAAPEDESAPSTVADAEPADPHHPPTGCRFHPRCPVGPLVLAGRDVCRDTEPVADGHRHRAACHFAGTLDLTSNTPNPTRSNR